MEGREVIEIEDEYELSELAGQASPSLSEDLNADGAVQKVSRRNMQRVRCSSGIAKPGQFDSVSWHSSLIQRRA